MDAKFSPGPWCVVKTAGRYSIIRQDGEPVAVVHFSDAKGAMDAALIAAAPDLLDALETMQRDGNDFAEWHPNFHKAIAKARAAIAKATGKEV